MNKEEEVVQHSATLMESFISSPFTNSREKLIFRN
jgi:hypothetical protein